MTLRTDAFVAISVTRWDGGATHFARIAAIITERIVRWDTLSTLLAGELSSRFSAATTHDLVPTYYIIKDKIEI